MRIIASIITGVSLIGCAGKTVYVTAPTEAPTTVETTVVPETTAAPTTTEPAPPPTTSRVLTEMAFLDLVKQETGLEFFMSDAEMLDMGYTVCDFLRNGGTTDELIAIILESAADNGVDEQWAVDIAGLSGAAVGLFCPEFNYMIG